MNRLVFKSVKFQETIFMFEFAILRREMHLVGESVTCIVYFGAILMRNSLKITLNLLELMLER